MAERSTGAASSSCLGGTSEGNKPPVNYDSGHHASDATPKKLECPEGSPPGKQLPKWKECNAHGLWLEVETRELAVRSAAESLRDIRRCLEQLSASTPGVDKWVNRIDRISRRKKKGCQNAIGFRGSTGAGKSSIINALLDHPNLLPTDAGQACTAVCVEISWNSNQKPECRYMARISRVSRDDWELEVANLFADIDDRESGKDGPNGEPDLDRNMRIESAFSKIKCVYPFVKHVADLKEWTVKKLLNHPNVKGLLGQDVFIEAAEPVSFAKDIKSYINSNVSTAENGARFAQWPLVQLVQLRLKSDILRDGIVLVDLPGSMDTNAARCNIAAKYQKDLSVTCAISRAPRAISDKPAHDLIGEVLQRTLQLDNHYSSDKLCFIMSQCDSSILTDAYIDDHPNVRKVLADEFVKVDQLNQALERVRAFIEEQKNEQKEIRRAGWELQRAFKPLDEEAKKIGISAPKSRKRKLDGDKVSGQERPLTEDENAIMENYKQAKEKLKADKKNNQDKIAHIDSLIRNAQDKISMIQERLENIESRKKAACIVNRNTISTQAIRADYELSLEQIGQVAGNEPLNVFCVSAWAYEAFRQGKRPPLGFLVPSDSGISALRDWLVGSTLETRNRNALAFLEEVENLKWSLAPWFSDTSTHFKMSAAVRHRMETMFAAKTNKLEESIYKAEKSIVEACKQTVTKHLYHRLAVCEKEAASFAEQQVKDWAQRPVVWSTHRALNRNGGVWSTHRGTEEQVNYDWNDDLVGLYHIPLLKSFNTTAYRKLPNHGKDHAAAISQIIQEFAAATVEDILGISTQLSDAALHWQHSVVRVTGPVEKQSRSIFVDNIEEQAREAHRKVKPKVLQFWSPIYKTCGDAHGKGHYYENQKRHIKHAKETSPEMYKQGSDAIKAAFEELMTALLVQLKGVTEPLIAQIKDEFELLLDNHSSSSDKVTVKEESPEAQAILKHEISGHLTTLEENWSVEVKPPIIIEELVIEEVPINIDNLRDPPNEEDSQYVELSDDDSTSDEDD